ncbi:MULTISPECIES: RDD family protein [Hymenobacter]|uniref:Uncharacterized membrane protein YckC, RDD family n=1 Tax=Hymenobacter mucosus TaxID=1411120 RepID=A0A238W2Z2_9BACT|nr:MULTISPECIES: RDD family protein [Hymenobacter]SNR40079.1 Uncharacterized membrane protein YckC, RDD family [Hymenobacter mucosus]
MSTIRIQTAQNVVVEYEIASVGERLVAHIIDSLVLGIYTVVCGFVVQYGLNSSTSQGILAIALIVIPALLYHPLCEIFFGGQSLGKHMRHIKVTRVDGTRPSVGDYLLRWLLALFEIQMTSGVVALLCIIITGRGQRLGDLAAGTTVVSLRPAAPDELNLGNVPPNYQVVFPQVAQLTDHDIALVRRLLAQALRRDNFVLLNEVANKVKTLTGIHTDLQDEPFLRTILRDYTALAQQEMTL